MNLEKMRIQPLAEVVDRNAPREGWNVELEVSVPVVRFGPFRTRALATEFRDLVLSVSGHSGREVYVDVRKVRP
jgi:hypothetical protein